MRTFTFVSSLFLLAACSKPSPTPTSPEPVSDSASEPATDDQPDVDSETPSRPELTAAACEAEGGTVVGDIGDGAIHKPDYVCPDSGEPPVGSIVAEPGGPVAIEGSVCCK